MVNVSVLFEGYSKVLDDGTMDANCSCTLITADKNIIVDTMTAWDGDRIVKALDKHELKPADIDYVVCSHSHADHIGNNNLFLNAEHIVGTSVNRGTMFYERNIKKEDYRLCEDVRVMFTPGHTSDDVTVIVQEDSVRIAVTGDLFEKEEDLVNPSIWQELGDENLRAVQANKRSEVLELVDFIVPGHGPMFRIVAAQRELARAQAEALKNV